MKSAEDLLRDAPAMIQERGWWDGTLDGKNGSRVGVDGSGELAVLSERVCLGMAVWQQVGITLELSECTRALAALATEIAGKPVDRAEKSLIRVIAEYNDTPGRTVEEILAVPGNAKRWLR